MTTRRQDSSAQAQGPAQALALQHAPEPRDLVRGLEKRVVAVELRVLLFDDVLDRADRGRRDVSDALEVLGDEQEVVGIDVAGLDEPRVFLGQRQGLSWFTRPHWPFIKLWRSRRARARDWRKLSALISKTSPPIESLAPRTAPRVKTSRCLRSRQSSMPIVQPFLASSTSSGTSTGTVFGSGRSRSGVALMAAP